MIVCLINIFELINNPKNVEFQEGKMCVSNFVVTAKDDEAANSENR